MNILKFELKGYISSMLIWSISITFFLLMYMAFFPSLAGDAETFTEMMSAFPDEVMALMGINPDLPMMSILGYYSLTMSFVFIPVAIQASNYGFNILSVEERELTADFLLTKPISRQSIFLQKFFGAFISLLVTNITIWVASLAALALFNADQSVAYSKVVVLLSSIILFQLFFLTVGMLISVMVKKIPSVISYSMALGFGMFILSSLGKMLSSDFLDILSPYNHFDPGYILVDGTYHIIPTIISVVIIIGSFISSYFLYLKRNIASL